jgi:hypothetical protein
MTIVSSAFLGPPAKPDLVLRRFAGMVPEGRNMNSAEARRLHPRLHHDAEEAELGAS